MKLYYLGWEWSPPGAKSYRNPVPGMRNLITGCWLTKLFPNNISYCCCPWLFPRIWRYVLIVKDTLNLENTRFWGVYLDLSQKAPHSELDLVTVDVLWKLTTEGNNQYSSSHMVSTNHRNDQHGTISLNIPKWHLYLGENQQLSN